MEVVSHVNHVASALYIVSHLNPKAKNKFCSSDMTIDLNQRPTPVEAHTSHRSRTVRHRALYVKDSAVQVRYCVRIVRWLRNELDDY